MADFYKLIARSMLEKAAKQRMKTEPFKHQLREYVQHTWTRSRALLWQMRTGKTKAVIDAACAMYSTCDIDGVLVVAPNGVHRNWILRQLPMHHWDSVAWRGFAWRFSDGARNLDHFEAFKKDCINTKDFLPWFAVNLEVLIRDDIRAAMKDFFHARRNVLLVIDESHHFAQPGSKRTNRMRGLAQQAKYVRILSGTSVEDSPLQWYAQAEILEPGASGCGTYNDFKSEFAEYEPAYGRNYPVLKGYKNMPQLRERIARYASVVLREDCEDLPPIQVDQRVIEPTERTRYLYQALKRPDLEQLLDWGFQEPPGGAALLTKLQQLEGGAIITPTGVVYTSDKTKLETVCEEVFGSCFIVFCEFLHEIEMLERHFKDTNQPFRYGVISGQHSGRDEVLHSFAHGQLHGIVAQSRAAGEGYDLSAADKIIWYSQTHTARVRNQANERATAVGGKSKQIVDLVMPGGVDEYYLQLTNTKTELADDIARHGLKRILEGLNI